MFEEILSRPAVNFPISFVTYLIVFSEAFLLGFAISWIYKKKSLSQDKNFQYSLWLIAPIVATLLLLIGSNLALSIGMVGSLSIIRFRTAVKDPADLTYLFILIMIGLGAGTQNFAITAIATFALGITLFYLSKTRPNSCEQDLLILKDNKSEIIEEVIKYVKQTAPQSRLTELFYNEASTDAIIQVSNIDEQIVATIKQKFNIKTIHLLKK